jgi:hypothetical protein
VDEVFEPLDPALVVVVVVVGGGGAGISKSRVVVADFTVGVWLPELPDWDGGVTSAVTVSVTAVPWGALRGPRLLIA